jgi:hypothetical protein
MYQHHWMMLPSESHGILKVKFLKDPKVPIHETIGVGRLFESL